MPTNKLPDPPGYPSSGAAKRIRYNRKLAEEILPTRAEQEERLLDMFHVAAAADEAFTRAMAVAQAVGVSYRGQSELLGLNPSTVQSRVREGRALLGMQQDLASREAG